MTQGGTGQDSRIEISALREQLRSLGYLDAGVDRFLLAPARQGRSAAGLAWRISMRVGLLAALLLAPAAAIGIGARLPGLIAGPRDAIVVVIYLAVIFGVVAGLASWAMALAVRAATRRATPRTTRRAGIAGGVLAGLACLVYLTLWWSTTAGAAWNSPVWTVIALVSAVAVSLLLGHAVSIAGLAVSAGDNLPPSVRAPILSWRFTVLLGLLAFLGASAVLAALSVRAEAPRAPSLVVVPTGLRLLVIGIDGWNPSALSTGAPVDLPNIRRLVKHTLDTTGALDTDPARVWTTIATGEPSERHGVTGIELRRVAGLGGSVGGGYSTIARALASVTDLARLTRPAAVTGTIRERKTFWEVAAESGLETAIVNWWATWPATGPRGIVISDRAALRLEHGGAQSAEIAPDRLYEPLRARWPAIVRQAEALASELLSTVDEPTAREAILRSARIDAEHALTARDPLIGTPDLLAVYLPGLDIAQHQLLLDTGGNARGPAALAARLDAIRKYYGFLDALVGRLVADLPDDFVVLLVTHPGRSREGRPALGIGGAELRDTFVDGSFRLVDIAPTVLYLLGVPLSEELAGRPLLDYFDRDLVRKHPVRRVSTYGRHDADQPAARGTPLDKETLERLRSLGYIR